MITEQEYKDAIAKHDEAEKVIQDFSRQRMSDFEARWDRFDKEKEYFKDEDLIYSAFVRCQKCGAGVAYPKTCGINHQWTCSNVLKGIGEDKGHSAFPFSYYEVKSEDQPSAQGATTRPSGQEYHVQNQIPVC